MLAASEGGAPKRRAYHDGCASDGGVSYSSCELRLEVSLAGDDGLCWPKSGVGMSGISAGFGVETSEAFDASGADRDLSEDTNSAAEVTETSGVLGAGGVLSVDGGSGCST